MPSDGPTLSLNVATRVTSPTLPDTVIVAAPIGASAAAVSVSVELALPLAATLTVLLENAAVTPVGRPVTDRLVAPANPYRLETVRLAAALAPCLTVTSAASVDTEYVATFWLHESLNVSVNLPLLLVPSPFAEGTKSPW